MRISAHARAWLDTRSNGNSEIARIIFTQAIALANHNLGKEEAASKCDFDYQLCKEQGNITRLEIPGLRIEHEHNSNTASLFIDENTSPTIIPLKFLDKILHKINQHTRRSYHSCHPEVPYETIAQPFTLFARAFLIAGAATLFAAPGVFLHLARVKQKQDNNPFPYVLCAHIASFLTAGIWLPLGLVGLTIGAAIAATTISIMMPILAGIFIVEKVLIRPFTALTDFFRIPKDICQETINITAEELGSRSGDTMTTSPHPGAEMQY